MAAGPSAYATLVQVHVTSGREEDFARASHNNASCSVHEDGNRRFDVLRNTADPSKFILYEVYERDECADIHWATGHYLEWRDTVADMMAQPRSAETYRLLHASHPPRKPGHDRCAAPAEVAVTHFAVRAGEGAAFAAAAQRRAESAEQAPGNVRFDVMQQKDNDCRLVVVEAWEPSADAAARGGWLAEVEGVLEQPPAATAYSAVFMPRRGLAAAPSRALPGGVLHPMVGFGTYKVGFIPGSAAGAGGTTTATGVDIGATVKAAVDAGYRLFDCAQFYMNEQQVGAALAESGVPRSELFLVSKVWTDNVYAGPQAVAAQVERCLRDLRTDCLDLFLVHWPVPGKHVEAYKALERLKAEGKLRAVGVSNYTKEDYAELMAAGCTKPAVNQIEVNPFLWRPETVRFFQQQGVLVQAYRPLAMSAGLKHDTVIAVAQRMGRTPAQVLGRWVLQHGACYIAKSEKPERIRENYQVTGFTLSEEDMRTLDSLTTAERLEVFKGHYRTNVLRDTPLAADPDAVQQVAAREFTVG
eukprot:TRINITY_DN3784_c0_g1_i1.p1 TRINITY_DN3784_c0_g1~~TRINITY_DN3784_c0_g1_i1.p1  ORF type:complete len:552 (+),score=180.87 TRINITY_DN3784_c0_g1_i1:72-1658(+)